MRSEQEIRTELERVEEEQKKETVHAVVVALNVRRWTLKWVLEQE